MSELISNVLDLMSFEVGEVHLQRDGSTDLDDLVDQRARRLEGRFGVAPGRSMRLPADLPADLRRCAAGDAGAGESARECRQAHAARTRITISAGIEGEPCASWSTTPGRGCRRGDPERLFAKFQRGRDEPTSGGAGLGLAICRAIIDAHGGQIQAMQRPGGGARFVFTLPTSAPAS